LIEERHYSYTCGKAGTLSYTELASSDYTTPASNSCNTN